MKKIKIKVDSGYRRIGIKVFSWESPIWYYGTTMYEVKRFFRAIREFYRSLINETIYIYFWSRDCDMCESTTFHKIYGQKALDRFIEASALDAEGPQGWDRITKEEFELSTDSTRDRIMEAYENGHGTSIYV